MLYENTGLSPFEEAWDWVFYPLITTNMMLFKQFYLYNAIKPLLTTFSNTKWILRYFRNPTLHSHNVLQERGENSKLILFAVRFNSMKDREHLSFSYGNPKLNKYINTMCYDCQWGKFWATLHKKPTWHFGNDCFIVFINTCTTLV